MTAEQHPDGDPIDPTSGDPHPEIEPGHEATVDPESTGATGWPETEAGHDAPPPPPPPSVQPPYAEPTPPSAIPADSRNWAMAAHLSAFVGAFFALAFVGPLVVWLVKKEEDAYVSHHAKEALNFNLSLLIYAVAGLVLTVVTIGIGAIVTLPLAAIAAIGWIVLTIVAAVKGANGEGYRYPLTLRLIN